MTKKSPKRRKPIPARTEGTADWLPDDNPLSDKQRDKIRKLVSDLVRSNQPRTCGVDAADGLIRDVEGIIKTWRGFQQGQEQKPSKTQLRKEVTAIDKAAEKLRLLINASSPETRELLDQGIFRVGKHGMAGRPGLGYPKFGDPWLEDVLWHQLGYTQLACSWLLKQQGNRGAPGKSFVIVAINRIAQALENWTGEPATAEKSSAFSQLVKICMRSFGQPTGDFAYLIEKALAEK